jgi:cation transport ATPase
MRDTRFFDAGLFAGAAMAFSRLFVVLNSLRLRSVTLTS